MSCLPLIHDGVLHTETKIYFLVSFLRLLTVPRFIGCSGRGTASQVEFNKEKL